MVLDGVVVVFLLPFRRSFAGKSHHEFAVARPLYCCPCRPAPDRQATAQEIAEKIWHGGPIVTADDARPTAEAVAIAGGRILAVGPLREVMAPNGAKTAVVDLGGRTMVTGFIDAQVGHGSASGWRIVNAGFQICDHVDRFF